MRPPSIPRCDLQNCACRDERMDTRKNGTKPLCLCTSPSRGPFISSLSPIIGSIPSGQVLLHRRHPSPFLSKHSTAAYLISIRNITSLCRLILPTFVMLTSDFLATSFP